MSSDQTTGSAKTRARERRIAAIDAAVEGEIEALAMAGPGAELPTLVRLRTATGTEIVSFNPGSSAVLSMSTIDAPFTRRQIDAAHRIEQDFMVEQSSSSNAAAIEGWLQTSLQATPAQAEAKAFGRLMRGAKAVKGPPEFNTRKYAAAHRIGWVVKHMNSVSWAMVEMVVRYQMNALEISRQTGYDRAYVTARVREALSELSTVLTNYAAMEDMPSGRDGDNLMNPAWDVT